MGPGHKPDRVMRALLLHVLILAGPACLADAPAPRMTGERLLKKLEPVEAAAISPDPAGKFTREELASLHTMRNVEFVQGYLAALYDETEGKTWCYDPKSKTPKPDTFYDESRWGLHRFTPTQLKRNAAALLVEVWSEKWPCPSNRHGGAK
jgi:hypothetical protein